MSENSNTSNEENLNSQVKKTIRFDIDIDYANAVIKTINVLAPEASELDEIVLVIKK